MGNGVNALPRERSLTLYLAAFAAALAIPLLIVAGLFAWSFTAGERARLEEIAARRNDEIIKQIDRLLTTRLAILEALATSPAIDAADFDRFDVQARSLAGMGIEIRLRRLDGQLVVDTGVPKGQTLPQWPMLAPMSEAIASGQPVFSDLFVSRGNGRFAVSIFVPVLRDGTTRYLISTIFDPSVFSRAMVDRGIAAPYFASLADRAGLIVARSERHEETLGRPLPGFARAVGESGHWTGVNPQGVKVSAFYRRSQVSGWLMTVGVDQAVLNASLTRSLIWLFGIAGVLLVASVGLATLILRRLTSATTAMTEAAGALARGQLTVAPRTGIQEINQAGDAFAQASIKLHVQATALARANRELEQRVEQRTEELRESEERYRLLAENASDLIILRNIAGKIFYASPSSLKLLGFTPAEMLDVTPSTMVHPDDWLRVDAINRAIGAGDELGYSIHRLRHKAGHWVWIQAAYSRLSGVGPDQPNIMVIVRDDTERQQHEMRLNQSNEALRQFSAIVSHDLQAPLRHINMFSDMLKLKVEASDAEAAGYATHIMASVERMQRLIRSLIAYTQVAYATVRADEVPLTRVVDDAMALVAADLRDSGGEVKVSRLPVVTGDADLLCRLFQNLLANALKYRSASAPVIHIRARAAGQFWELSVEDNGIGIDPQYRDRIFEIFRRLHKDESRYAGMGLGLALGKRIVESHGGEIWLDTDHSPGACFRFTLPRAKGPHA
ncbi:MAG: PAS domain S-box protein [Phreatobacter sp.]|uniref:sensor histidine kinase n=1 Tax=Phreatobacter sp. TaxID=1966341 RepID=UPI001A5280FD|nr:ATP-binding protein [Phreatobacter sp.]MBL8568893.1 PAS domain S-box protein [Phreatobacter sp.]